MKKNLFMVLLVGVCLGQEGFFSFLKPKKQKIRCTECSLPMKETVNAYVCRDNHIRIQKSDVKIGKDGRYIILTDNNIPQKESNKEANQVYVQKSKTVDKHFFEAGQHLQNFFIRQIYAIGLVNLTFYLALNNTSDLNENNDGEDDNQLLLRLSSLGATYNFIVGLYEVNAAGKELKKASYKLRKQTEDNK